MSLCLPMPDLRMRDESGILLLTDDGLARACGVRIAFTGRSGGASARPYATLNLGIQVGDEKETVEQNRAALVKAIGADEARLITLNQVHGDTVIVIRDTSPDIWEEARRQAESGADAVVVTTCGVAPLLCFADCVPVIVVSPSGAFAVAHAGWRGVIAATAVRAAEALAACDVQAQLATVQKEALAGYNVYLGPHIASCCFETGLEVRDQFFDRFGEAVLVGEDHIDLAAALRIDLEQAGISAERITDCDICTSCNAQDFFSYRASGGTCGRHGAIAFRKC